MIDVYHNIMIDSYLDKLLTLCCEVERAEYVVVYLPGSE